MQSRHRRAPSAMPTLGFEDEISESLNYFNSTNPVPAQKTQLPLSQEPKNLKNCLKQGGSSQVPKFSHNYSSSVAESRSFQSGSNEKLGQKINQCKDLKENKDCDKTDKAENPMNELNHMIEEIISSRNEKSSKLNGMKNTIKNKLMQIIHEEPAEIDTDRRKESIKCSEETVEGPGSSFNMDDISLVKFDISMENSGKKKAKILKFKDHKT